METSRSSRRARWWVVAVALMLGAALFAAPALGAPGDELKLTASDGAPGAEFGWDLAVSGNTMLIAAATDNGLQGSVYAFTRSGSAWTESQKLAASDPVSDDRFGWSVAIDGNTAVVGARGHDHTASNAGAAYVFTYRKGVWSETQELLASDRDAGDLFGHDVAMANNTLAVGAPGTGAVYVYTRSGKIWTELQKLTASTGAGDFGSAVAIEGNTMVVGGPLGGAAYVFERKGGTWTETAILTASGATGADHFGVSVALSDRTIVVGAFFDDGFEGSAWVFERTGKTWTETQKLTASDGAALDLFGGRVALEANRLVIGAYHDLGSPAPGAAYVFTRDGGDWSETAKLTASDGFAGDAFGKAVAVRGNLVLVGAERMGGSGIGAAYVYTVPGYCVFWFGAMGGTAVGPAPRRRPFIRAPVPVPARVPGDRARAPVGAPAPSPVPVRR